MKAYWLVLLTLSICLLLSAMGLAAQAADDAPIEFADTAVEVRIRGILGKPEGDIYASDMASITEFSFDPVHVEAHEAEQLANREKLTSFTIHDLTDLAYCVNLKSVIIVNQPLESVAPLASLGALCELVLDGCGFITDLSPLAGMASLESVSLYDVPADLTPVLSLPRLKSFTMARGATTEELSALSQRDQLEVFVLVTAPDVRVDYTPLAGHHGMRDVWFYGIDRETFALLLPAWPDLRALTIVSGEITDEDLLLLEGKALTQLILENCAVSDISILEAQRGLSDLRLLGCQVKDISALSSLEALQVLDLRDNPIEDFTPLYALSALESLSLTAAPEESGALADRLPNTYIHCEPSGIFAGK